MTLRFPTTLSLRMDDVCICTDIHMSYTEIIANVTLPGNMSVTGAIIKKINDKEGMMFAIEPDTVFLQHFLRGSTLLRVNINV